MPRKVQHVVPRNGKWAVGKSGPNRARRNFETGSEAIEAAHEVARVQGADLYIHGKDGRIREKSSYRNAPFPPLGSVQS